MFPFSSILQPPLSYELQVPGQDSPATYTAFASYPSSAQAGFRFQSSGSFQRNQNGTYTGQSDKWINNDVHGIVDAGLYECRYTSLSGNTSFFNTNMVEDTWYDCDRATASYGYCFYTPGEFTAFVSKSVNMIIQVREKANHANIRSGDLTLTAQGEGLL